MNDSLNTFFHKRNLVLELIKNSTYNENLYDIIDLKKIVSDVINDKQLINDEERRIASKKFLLGVYKPFKMFEPPVEYNVNSYYYKYKEMLMEKSEDLLDNLIFFSFEGQSAIDSHIKEKIMEGLYQYAEDKKIKNVLIEISTDGFLSNNKKKKIKKKKNKNKGNEKNDEITSKETTIEINDNIDNNNTINNNINIAIDNNINNNDNINCGKIIAAINNKNQIKLEVGTKEIKTNEESNENNTSTISNSSHNNKENTQENKNEVINNQIEDEKEKNDLKENDIKDNNIINEEKEETKIEDQKSDKDNEETTYEESQEINKDDEISINGQNNETQNPCDTSCMPVRGNARSRLFWMKHEFFNVDFSIMRIMIIVSRELT